MKTFNVEITIPLSVSDEWLQRVQHIAVDKLGREFTDAELTKFIGGDLTSLIDACSSMDNDRGRTDDNLGFGPLQDIEEFYNDAIDDGLVGIEDSIYDFIIDL